MSGNVWMFSDEIDDEDLEFMSHDYVTYNMACEYYRLGIKKRFTGLVEIAER